MAENLGKYLPNEGRSPKPGHRMAAERMLFPWRWYRWYDFHGFGCHLGNVGQRVFPKWFNVQVTVIYLIGIAAIVYVIIAVI